MSKAAKAVALDTWICDHYDVLPTEDRYKRLTDRQKYLLFQGFINRPSDADIHRAYQISQRLFISHEEEANWMKRGYSLEQIKRMKHEIEKAEIGSG